ncbi:pilin [Micromonospora sp. NPDC005324]|uniref:pilin n=1 Tax=Micromonospora sp. NPDC005324 TaxID=3157033 RepID=UPI0033AA581B
MSHIPARLRALTHSRAARVTGRAAGVAGEVLLVLSVPAAAYADSGVPMLAVNSLPIVIFNIQTWVMGILFAIATLFLILSGVFWATAGGDTAQVERAKSTFKNALIGYALAVLAPILLEIAKGIVGG